MTRVLLFIFWVFALVGPRVSLADQPAPLRIGIMDLPPYSYLDAERNRRGILIEVAEAILKESGLEGTVETVPIKRLFITLQKGNSFDCTITAMDEGPFTKKFDLIETIGWDLQFGFIPRRGVDLSSYADLSKLRIAVARGILLTDQFDKDESLNKILVSGYPSAMMMLDRGRVDAAAGVVSSLLFSAKEAGLTFKNFGKPMELLVKPVWLYCTFRSPALKHREQIRKAVVAVRESGLVREVIARYQQPYAF